MSSFMYDVYMLIWDWRNECISQAREAASWKRCMCLGIELYCTVCCVVEGKSSLSFHHRHTAEVRCLLLFPVQLF